MDRTEIAVVIEHAIPRKVLPDEKELACNLVDEPNICTDNTTSKKIEIPGPPLCC